MRISDWSSDVCSSDLYGVSHENAHPTETFARGTAAIRDVLTRQRLADEQKIIAAARHFGELAREYGIGSEFRIVWRDDLRDESMLRALHCDLIVAAHPKPADLPSGWSAERLLLATGITVLMIPEIGRANAELQSLMRTSSA